MKSLTPTAESHCRSRYNEPVALLEIDWSGADTGRYAERALEVDGVMYDGIIIDIGEVSCSFDNPASERRPLSVTLFPDEALKGRLATGFAEGKPARLKLLFAGTSADDSIELFSGFVGAVKAAAPDTVELLLTGMFSKHDRMLPLDIVSIDDFPKAEAGDVGKPLPLVFGEVPGLPALKVKTGQSTRLRGSILSDDTTIEVDDTGGFPATGTLLIEEEQVTYTGADGNVFTGCVRGANGTEPAEHLNRRQVIEHLTEHIYLVAGHACASVHDIRVAGAPVEEGGCVIDRNNTTLAPGKTLATVTFVNRPRVRVFSKASRFLEMQFDETAAGNEALNPEHCYDVTIEGFATLVATISGSPENDTLRLRQTTDVTSYETKFGEILKVFLIVEHFASKKFADDYLSVHVAGQSYTLAKPGEEDTAGGGGEVDIDHAHTHSITGEHTHTMTVKKEALFTNHIIQVGGTTGGWSEVDDIAGGNLNKSGFTTTASTDRSLQCFVAATTSKGSVQKIQFCCRRGESNMAGSFYLRFYQNGDLKKTYVVTGTSYPATWKSGWETIGGLTWEDLDNSNTYILITPVAGNAEPIRLFGVWYELEYLEQPSAYEGTGVKDSADVNAYSAANAHVINEEPVRSSSVAEAIDITGLVANDWSWFNGREVWVNYNVVGSNDGVKCYLLHVFFEVEFAPFEDLISDDVTCAVRGVETNGDGTGALVENPADVIKHVLVNKLGFDENERLDADSFERARSSLEALGARFAFALTRQARASSLLERLALQARCRLSFDSGKHRLAFRPDAFGEPVRALTPDSLLEGGCRMEHSGLDDVRNRIIGYHTRDYGVGGPVSECYSAVTVAEDPESQAEYGAREWELELFALRDAAYASDLLNFLADRLGKPVRRYAWSSFLRDIDLERGDIVEISDLRFDLLKVKGEIARSVFRAGSGSRRRLDTLSFQAELEPFEFLWHSPPGTFIRQVGDSFLFVVEHELVARLNTDGNLFLKGFALTDQSLPGTAGETLAFDESRRSLAFGCEGGGQRLIELDGSGNLLAPSAIYTDQSLAFAGGDNEIESDSTKLWINADGERLLEADPSCVLLRGSVFTDSDWNVLYG